MSRFEKYEDLTIAKVVVYLGKFWGVVYPGDHGSSESYGWVDGIQNARLEIKENKYLDLYEKFKATDWTDRGFSPEREEFEKGSVIEIEITTTYKRRETNG